MLRSSYINWFFTGKKTISQKEKLANQMRHSVSTAQRNYFKLDIETTDDKDELMKQYHFIIHISYLLKK